MMGMTYTVNARRSGAWWAIDVAELPGVFSQARRLDGVEAMARDAIASFRDVAPDSFGVAVIPHIEKSLNDLVIKAVAARGRAAAAQAEASNVQREAIRRLMESGLPMRDIGQIVGVSHQRVGQLASTAHQSEFAAALVGAFGPVDRKVDVYDGRGQRRSTLRSVVDSSPQSGMLHCLVPRAAKGMIKPVAAHSRPLQVARDTAARRVDKKGRKARSAE